jgi:hypothetical protein
MRVELRAKAVTDSGAEGWSAAPAWPRPGSWPERPGRGDWWEARRAAQARITMETITKATVGLGVLA